MYDERCKNKTFKISQTGGIKIQYWREKSYKPPTDTITLLYIKDARAELLNKYKYKEVFLHLAFYLGLSVFLICPRYFFFGD